MRSWLTWLPRIVWLIVWFFGEQLKSTIHVVRDAFRPHHRLSPGFVRFHTHCETEFEVTLLSALITLTPGTLTLGAELSEEAGAWTIAVHGMYFEDPDDLIADLRDMETHVLSAIRREGFTP